MPHADTSSADARLAAGLADFLERAAQRGAFSGVALLARREDVLFRSAYGPACREFDVPNREDTRFNLGSMNKMFTAVAAARLIETGRLGWDDPVSRHLDEGWLADPRRERITVRQLLTHTSGLGDYFHDGFDRAARHLHRDLADYRPLVAGDAPAFEPGTGFRYSNVGYILLGAIIEAAGGEDYFEQVRRSVYEPAGMTDTDCFDLDVVVPNRAVGYSPIGADGGDAAARFASWRSNLFAHVIRGGPAGGGFSTVDDLLRFDRALRAGRLLLPETLERLWTPAPLSPPGRRYGCGFRVQEVCGGRVVGHTGTFAGISNVFEMHLDSGHTLVVLANQDGAAPPVSRCFADMLATSRPSSC